MVVAIKRMCGVKENIIALNPKKQRALENVFMK